MSIAIGRLLLTWQNDTSCLVFILAILRICNGILSACFYLLGNKIDACNGEERMDPKCLNIRFEWPVSQWQNGFPISALRSRLPRPAWTRLEIADFLFLLKVLFHHASSKYQYQVRIPTCRRHEGDDKLKHMPIPSLHKGSRRFLAALDQQVVAFPSAIEIFCSFSNILSVMWQSLACYFILQTVMVCTHCLAPPRC